MKVWFGTGLLHPHLSEPKPCSDISLTFSELEFKILGSLLLACSGHVWRGPSLNHAVVKLRLVLECKCAKCVLTNHSVTSIPFNVKSHRRPKFLVCQDILINLSIFMNIVSYFFMAHLFKTAFKSYLKAIFLPNLLPMDIVWKGSNSSKL